MATKSKVGDLKLMAFAGAAAAATGKPTPTPDAKIDASLIDVLPQVRTVFDEATLAELAASIDDQSLFNPIIVLAKDDGRYRLIAGERRLRAWGMTKVYKLQPIPVMVKRGLTDAEVRKIQVAENNERDDISPYDEAMAVCEDVAAFGAAEAAKIWNRSAAWVSKRAGIKKLKPEVADLMKSGKTSDLELLGSLSQMANEDKGAYELVVIDLEAGVQWTRDEVRERLNSIRTQKTAQKEFAARRAAEQAKQAAGAATAGAQGAGKPKPTDAELLAEKQADAKHSLVWAGNSMVGGSWAKPATAFETLCGDEVAESGITFEQAEWLQWHTALNVFMPVFDKLGVDKSLRFLKAMQAELKDATPADILARVNVAVPEYDDGSIALANMPEGWAP